MFRRRHKSRFPAPSIDFVHLDEDTCIRRLDFEGYNLQKMLVEGASRERLHNSEALGKSDILAWGQVLYSTKPDQAEEITALVNADGLALWYAVDETRTSVGPAYGPRARAGSATILNFLPHSTILARAPDTDGMMLWNWADPDGGDPWAIALAPYITGDPRNDRRAMEVISTLVAMTDRSLSSRR